MPWHLVPASNDRAIGKSPSAIVRTLGAWLRSSVLQVAMANPRVANVEVVYGAVDSKGPADETR